MNQKYASLEEVWMITLFCEELDFDFMASNCTRKAYYDLEENFDGLEIDQIQEVLELELNKIWGEKK